jgi:hypothetical protein
MLSLDKEYNQIVNLMKFNVNFRYSDPVFETWAEWFGYVKTTFKPNKISLREDKFKVLGI